jgi:hypothetical protein
LSKGSASASLLRTPPPAASNMNCPCTARPALLPPEKRKVHYFNPE